MGVAGFDGAMRVGGLGEVEHLADGGDEGAVHMGNGEADSGCLGGWSDAVGSDSERDQHPARSYGGQGSLKRAGGQVERDVYGRVRKGGERGGVGVVDRLVGAEVAQPGVLR